VSVSRNATSHPLASFRNWDGDPIARAASDGEYDDVWWMYRPLLGGAIDDRLETSPTFTGWAFNPGNPADSLTVRVWVDSGVNCADYSQVPPASFMPTSTPTITTTTDVPRADVNDWFGLSGTHGFSFTLPALPEGTHDVCVWAEGALAVDGQVNFTPGGAAYTVQPLRPPVISNVSMPATGSVLANTTAAVTWTTDLLSDSTVEWGPTPAFGRQQRYGTLTRNHLVWVGLGEAGLYYVRVRSRVPIGGFEAVSPTYTVRVYPVPSCAGELDVPWRPRESHARGRPGARSSR